MRDTTRTAGLVGWLAQDDGFAMAMAISVAAIVFMLATMLITLSVYRTQQSSIQRAQTKATHMADAGLNAYVAEMRFNADYVDLHPGALTGTQGDGSWRVTAIPPAAGSNLATVTSVGTVGSVSRTIHATVRPVGFADYAFFTNAAIYFTSTDVVHGNVRSNGQVRLATGTQIYGNLIATGGFRNSGGSVINPPFTQVSGGVAAVMPAVNFSTASSSAADMVTSATAEGQYYPAPAYGGHVIIFGSPTADRVTIKQFNAINTSTDPGALTFTSTTETAYPPSGVFAFGGNVFVQGTYSQAVTVYSAASILIRDDVVSSNSLDKTITCGLMAKNNIYFPTWMAGSPNTLDVQAALFAQTGQISYDNKTTWYSSYNTYRTNLHLQPLDLRPQLNIRGSLVSYNQIYTQDADPSNHGYTAATFDYDTNLDQTAPPLWPPLGDGEMRVVSWLDY